jgi:hypothetical protein
MASLPQRPAVKHTALYALLVLISLLRWCDGFATTPRAIERQLIYRCRSSRRILHQSLNKDDDSAESETEDAKSNKKDESYSWAELQADPELSRMELESSMRRKNVMLLPQRLSQAVSTLAWTFVIVGIILNQLGYAYIRDPSGGIGIGTLE